MNFERGIDPMKSLELGIREQMKKIVQDYMGKNPSPMSVSKLQAAEIQIKASLELNLGAQKVDAKVKLRRPREGEYFGKADWMVHVKLKIKGVKKPMEESIPWMFDFHPIVFPKGKIPRP